MELPNRHKLDTEAAEALSKISDRHRKEAVRLMGNPPDVSRIPESTWQQWQDELDAEIAAIVLLVFFQSAQYHGGSEDLSMQRAQSWAPGFGQSTARQVTQTTFERLSTASETWRNRLQAGTDVTDAEIEDTINRIFGPARMSRVAIDSVTVAQTAGGEQIIAELFGRSDDDWWQNNPGLSESGPCKKCERMHGQPRYIWESMYPEGPGPSVHPGCVCEIRYINLDNAGNN